MPIFSSPCGILDCIFDKPPFWPILALSWSLFFSIFMLNPHEKGIDLLPLTQICWYCGLSVFSGRTFRVLRIKIAFTRSWRKNKGQTEPRESQRKRKQHTHDRAAGPERWHDLQHGRATNRASTHGCASSGFCDLYPVFGLFWRFLCFGVWQAPQLEFLSHSLKPH